MSYNSASSNNISYAFLHSDRFSPHVISPSCAVSINEFQRCYAHKDCQEVYYILSPKPDLPPIYQNPSCRVIGFSDFPYSPYRQAVEKYIDPIQHETRLKNIDKCNIFFNLDECTEQPIDPKHGTVRPKKCNDPLCPQCLKDKRTKAFKEIYNKLFQTSSYALQYLTFTLPEDISLQWWTSRRFNDPAAPNTEHYLTPILPDNISKFKKKVIEYAINQYITEQLRREGKINPDTEKIESGTVITIEYVGKKDIFKPNIHANVILSDYVLILDKKTKKVLRKIHTPDRFWNLSLLSAFYTVRFNKIFKTEYKDPFRIGNKIIYKNLEDLPKVIRYITKPAINTTPTPDKPDGFTANDNYEQCYTHNGISYPLDYGKLFHLLDLIPQGAQSYTWHGFYYGKKFHKYIDPQEEFETESEGGNGGTFKVNKKEDPIFPDYEEIETKVLHECAFCGAPTVPIGVCNGDKFISYSSKATKEQISLAEQWLINIKSKLKK